MILEVGPGSLISTPLPNSSLYLLRGHSSSSSDLVIRNAGIHNADNFQCCLGFGNTLGFIYILIPIFPPSREGPILNM